jgi:glycosyltransferase involved in cell wall biosynthesis
MAVQLRRTLTRQFPDAIKVVQWIYHPAQHWILDVIADARRIYECYDEHAWTTRGAFKARTWQQEREILTSVDLTFVTTTGLMKTRMPLSRRLELLPNGVPEFFFDEVGSQPDPLDWIPQPRLGYLGNARSVVDFDLLEQLLRRRPEWHMVFLGPIEHRSAVAALRALPDAHFLGTRPSTDVPNIVRHFDVGLVPLLDNEFTRVMSTLKLCEYLAVGVPVVATDLPGVRLFGNSIRLAPREVEGFERAIAETLALDRSALSPHLIAAARPYSWNEICRRQVVPVLADVFHW